MTTIDDAAPALVILSTAKNLHCVVKDPSVGKDDSKITSADEVHHRGMKDREKSVLNRS